MKNIFELIFQKNRLEKSKNIYQIPFAKDTIIRNILYDWPSHTGPFRGAVDFAVELNTDVLAAQEGTVIEVVNQHTLHGPSKEYAPYLNYITIKHTHGEFSQYAHLAKDTITVQVGDQVQTGQKIAETGLNGWMEEPFLEHLHFFVFKLLPGNSFKGLKIRFQTKPRETQQEIAKMLQ